MVTLLRIVIDFQNGIYMQVADLKEMCKERKITGYSKMRKSQLVRVLKDAMLVDSK